MTSIGAKDKSDEKWLGDSLEEIYDNLGVFERQNVSFLGVN